MKRVLVTMTDKGKQALDLSKNREFSHKVMSSLSAERKNQLESALEILRDAAINELSLTQKTILRPSQISKYYTDTSIK